MTMLPHMNHVRSGTRSTCSWHEMMPGPSPGASLMPGFHWLAPPTSHRRSPAPTGSTVSLSIIMQ